MALNQWFKFYGGEYLSDPKIASLSAQERSCWITLLSLASISSTPGKIEYLTVEVLLDKSGVPFDPYNPENWNASLGVLTRFEKMKMIAKSDDGTIEIMNWKKRQETALTNAERQAKYRESNAKVTEHVTKVTLDKIRVDKNRIDTSVADAPQEESRYVSEYEIPKSKPKYPNAKKVFSLFQEPQKSWNLNTTELKHAELLFERGVDKVSSALKFVRENRAEPFFPSITKPSDLERKWKDMEAFADRNDL